MLISRKRQEEGFSPEGFSPQGSFCEGFFPGTNLRAFLPKAFQSLMGGHYT